jgi:hypothetical protein
VTAGLHLTPEEAEAPALPMACANSWSAVHVDHKAEAARAQAVFGVDMVDGQAFVEPPMQVQRRPCARPTSS